VTIPSTAELLAHSVSTESVGTRELSLGGR
jgi:hypothetical protein